MRRDELVGMKWHNMALYHRGADEENEKWYQEDLRAAY
jgi:hypothetical protein